MAIFRKIHTSFWSDSFVSELEKEKKLFYLYLLTNERTRQCGVYEITKKQIAYDLGYTIDTVSKQLDYFIKKGKVKYNEATNELAIGNWLKYNLSTSPKVQLCINKEFKLVKDTLLIEYVKSIDTHPQEEQEEEQEEEEEKKQIKIPFEIFWKNYPRKEEKPKAKERWDSLSKETQEKIIQTLPLFLKGKEVRFIPMPVTYFNNQRWEDEITPAKKETTYIPTQNNSW